jgi:hypothetical protein
MDDEMLDRAEDASMTGKAVQGKDAGGRQAALEKLWSALKDRENTKIGYNPAVPDACAELRRLEKAQGLGHE